MIKTVFFDFDGVLANSKAVHDSSWVYAIETILDEKHNPNLSLNFSGGSPELISKNICSKFNQDAKHNLILECKNNYLYKNLHNINPFPGVLEFCAFLKSKNISIGIASNASSHYIVKCIENWNLDIPVSYGYEDYKMAKPDPEAYLKLANYFNISPDSYKDILVFEDSETGLKSALAAGMKTAYIKSHCKVNQEIINNVDYSFKNVLESKLLFE